VNPCEGQGGDIEFSYLWAANSSQSTISKIDTQTVTEVGRFYTEEAAAGSPSRTSVNSSGDVAVANRNSGVTKFFADVEDCADTNGVPGIQTSDSNIPLAWDEEECRAWHQEFNYYTQRPVAWVPGEQNPVTCEWEEQKLWISGIVASGAQPEIRLLNGDTGETEGIAQLAGWNGDQWGVYGGAVDGDGNFWGSQLGSAGKLVRVNIEDLSFELFDAPAGPHWYGMTVDSDGYVWLCHSSAGRFDPETETWEVANVGGGAGCMADAGDDGLLWMAAGQNVIGVNRETLLVEKTWAANGSYGISIDFYGHVWAVAFGSNATRVDQETGDAITYNGLVGAYTYSDMTGFAMANAGAPT
jgi:streptogramin lyase